uniref:Uncharacterized protein n=1 Tax=Strombidinopsis acuminata TaxID=141414 RepID=A0A7S3RP81_9SPIT|eukprot:scaffold125916_cov26-Tisochrysis_lutea.AAC.2
MLAQESRAGRMPLERTVRAQKAERRCMLAGFSATMPDVHSTLNLPTAAAGPRTVPVVPFSSGRACRPTSITRSPALYVAPSPAQIFGATGASAAVDESVSGDEERGTGTGA